MIRALQTAALTTLLVLGVGAPAGSGTLTFGLADVSPTPELSSNWAGYVAAGYTTDPASGASTPIAFTSVTGTWRQPQATCVAGNDPTYSAVWVGIGGYSEQSQALEQIGTSADCTAAGTPVYYAWYELVPKPVVRIPLKLVPGDTITTSVNVSGTSVLVQIKNRTRGTSFTKTLDSPAPDLTSAEWIAEAPSECSRLGCRVLPLANFGTVTFTRIAVHGNTHPGTLTDPAWTVTPVRLLPDTQSGTLLGRAFGQDTSLSGAGADPNTPTPDGRSFSVSWRAQTDSNG